MSRKPPKVEGNGEVRKELIKPERLPSLFSQTRDLSLTKTNQRAQAANKRSYAPNLNVARNKNIDKNGDNEPRRDQKSERGGRNQRGRGGKNNLNNRKSNLVQVGVGLFSEGIAAVPLNRKSEYGGGSRDTSSVADVLQKPRIIKRDQKPDKTDLDAEQKTLTDLLGEGDDELNLDDDSKTSSSDDFLPYKIRDPNKRSVEFNSKKLEMDVKIKVEPVDDEDVVMGNNSSPETSLLNGTSIKMEPGLKTEASDRLFNASPNDFMLLQLPDTLPGRAPDAMDSQTPSTSSTTPQNPNLCSLEHLDEGLIGKLVRYRSGKTKLMIGETVYDIDVGLASDFQQHAVTINANSTERSANVYSLGQINAKYNVTPDWIHLFHKMTP